jgi:hypothetical protein
MKFNRLLRLSLSISVLMAAASATEISSPTSKLAQPMLGNLPPQVCLLDSEVSTALKTLSHGRHDGQQKALAILKANAARSTTCRKQVITNAITELLIYLKVSKRSRSLRNAPVVYFKI